MNKNSDSAFYYFNRSATSSTDKKQIASAYQSMAFIQSNAGDNYGAQESLIMSLRSLDEHDAQDQDYLARDYNGLGMSYSSLNQYDQAINYYKLALKYASELQLRSNILNNQGNAYKDLKSYAKALESYEAAIKITGNKGAAFSRVLTNLAITRWLQNRYYNPAPELWHSLGIRILEKDIPGENSSYAHLAEFYANSNPDSAIWYAQKMLAVANKLHNADDQSYALRKLIMLAPPKKANAYFQRYQAIEDSAETKRNAAKNQFAVIRYNVEKAKAENLQLQKKNTERRYELIAALALTGFTTLSLIWWYRRRRLRLQLQAEKDIQESKFRLSKKVHDQVANGVYRIMSEVEHNGDLDKSRLLDQLDTMYEISRNIAHDETGLGGEFTERLSTLLNAFKKSSIKLAVTGNEPGLWQSVGVPVREQLELVLQELMVNMSKHSRATQAHVGFTLKEGWLKVEYHDNGVGMSNQDKNGKGLLNTVSRIEGLKGSIKFESPNEKGLRIEIQVPLKK
ncbi:MAG: ATP-binding protein [Sphingobacteriales bacterium]